jgi:uncharacterized protein
MAAILDQARLSWYGPHGLPHWARVRENGLRLASMTGANPQIIELFAVFHDSCRHNEGHDPRHGARGAKLAAKLRAAHLRLDDDEFSLLQEACAHHAAGRKDAQLTIQTCWDADRLDLGRVWITPDPERLCTGAAKSKEIIQWADGRSRRGYSPPGIIEYWTSSLSK